MTHPSVTIEAGLTTGTVSAMHGGLAWVGDYGCRWLEHAVGSRPFQIGDQVLVWREPDSTNGIIVGRIHTPTTTPTLSPDVSPARSPGQPSVAIPDELVISATKKLTLRCGDGEIVMRGDGKILIRGIDLVAKAKRANRIKGGQVVIN